MALNLQQTMGEFVTLYLTARDTPNKDTAKALGKVAQDLIANFSNALKLIQDGVQKEIFNKPSAELDKLIRDIEARITIEPVSDLEKFFSGVTQAVVGAQEDLNQQSLDYIKHLPRQKDGRPIIPPSYFAIPSVKAEMKVGVSQVKGKGLNIILFSTKEQRQNYSESTISFEVVTAPAPPSVEPPPVSSPPDETTKRAALKPPLAGPKPLALPLTRTLTEALTPGAEFEPPPAADDFARALDLSDVFELAERSAVLAERERALDIREDWLDVRARLLGTRAILLADKTVLDFIRQELRARGKELGKLYDNTEDLALVLGYTRQDRTGYLVVWPGRAETDRDETWRELRVFHLMRVGDALVFDTSLFETTPGEGFLLVTSRKDLLTLSPEEVADLAINLGDVLVRIVLVFNEWLKEE